MTDGDQFSLSDDGTLLAVLIDGQLFLMHPDGTNKRPIASRVTWFQWRPGTHDLLYAAYSDTTGMIEWRRIGPDEVEVLLGGDRFPPTVSPSGTWLISLGISSDGRELRAINLDDLSPVVMIGGTQGFPELKWAATDTIAFIEDGRRVVLLSIPTGERQIFLESEVALSGPMQWTTDGSLLAVPTRDNALSIWSQEGLQGLCAGQWRPIGWSSSRRYLALEQGSSGSLYVLDTFQLDECAPMQIPGKWARFLEWHPSADLIVASLLPAQSEKVQVEVWSLSAGKPVQLGEVGYGDRAVWMVP